MLEHSYLSDFDDNDVVAFTEHSLNKSKRLKDAMAEICKNKIEPTVKQHMANNQILYPDQVPIVDESGQSTTYSNQWMGDGVHCEVLKLGAKEWQKGKIKIRVSVEFYPDEPENKPMSVLDDIRQSMT